MRWISVATLPILLTGCFSTGDALRLTLDDPSVVDIDSLCAGCFSESSATVAYASGAPGPADALFSMAQYRVDYTLEDGRPMDFFADTVSGDVAEGETLSFTFQAAGARQRAIVRDSFGSDGVTGTASLTLEGYDYDGAVWTVGPVDFEFEFSNLSDDESDPVDTGL